MTDEPGQPDPSGRVRASDAEREAVVERLREATAEGRLTFEVPHGNVDITATTVMGDVRVYVPDGVAVELSGIAVMGDKNVMVREVPAS